MPDADVSTDNGQDDSEAADMLAEAVDNGDGSQEENSEPDLPPAVKAKIAKANNEAKNLRKKLRELEPLAQEAQQLRDSQKSELEKLTEQLQAAETERAAASAAQMRIDVALDKAPDGMSLAQVRKLAKRLTGSTREELEEDAGELFADFVKDDERKSGATRPKENLRTVPLSTPAGADKTDMNEWMRTRGANR